MDKEPKVQKGKFTDQLDAWLVKESDPQLGSIMIGAGVAEILIALGTVAVTHAINSPEFTQWVYSPMDGGSPSFPESMGAVGTAKLSAGIIVRTISKKK